MALETWLIKVKTAISNRIEAARTTTSPNKKMGSSIKKYHHNNHHHHHHHHHIGVLAFEIAGLMSKLIQLWQSLNDKNIVRLRHEAISLEGVRKIVSNDDIFLLGLACAEVVENLRLVSKSVSRLGKRCQDSNLQNFDSLFDEFADTGLDHHNWVLGSKEMESKLKKMDRYVTLTANLYREIDELSEIEHGLKKLVKCTSTDHEALIKEKKIHDLQQKMFWEKQEVKNLKETSLWSKNFDTVTSLLAKSVFTSLARIKLVFGISKGRYSLSSTTTIDRDDSSSLPRSLSVSATVYPTTQLASPPSCNINFVSLSTMITYSKENDEQADHLVNYPDQEEEADDDHDQAGTTTTSFFESNSKLLKPPSTTLGGVALALHYANLIIVIEKMIRSPQLVGIDARDDLYGMLPTSIRVSLRERLRGVGFSASDPSLASEWRDALGRILGWLSPLAHNMIKWQSERSFEQQNLMLRNNVLLLQTLFFANQTKTEAAITELLVGLNYIWRFEREMNAKALLEYSNINGLWNLQQTSTSC